MNRVTDTCIPEGEAMRRMEKAMLEVWTDADKKGERYFPHEFFYKVLLSGKYEKYYQIDPKDSWMLAAAKKNLPIVVPGWEDATLGNMYAAAVIRGDVKNVHTVRTGIEYMTWLAEFYTQDGHEEKHARHVPDWRRHLRRLSDLRRADAASGFAAHQRAALGLLLPDQRFHHELRQLFRRGAERKNHLGQARREDAEIHHRIRRHHCRAADFRPRPRLVNFMKPNDFSDARVLVTGGAGFIGSALVWALNRRGCDNIVVCDILGRDEKWRNLTPLRFADYVEAADLLPRLQSGALGKFDLVLHLGACSATTEKDATYLVKNNYEFTRDLAALVARAEKRVSFTHRPPRLTATARRAWRTTSPSSTRCAR